MSLADWRAMTPPDWRLHISSWNAANAPDEPAAPSLDEFEELKQKYG